MPNKSHRATPLLVLVVDDESLARQRLLKLLALEDNVTVVEAASTGAQAIETIRAGQDQGNPIDLVFLDIQMPGKTGLDVVRAIGPENMPVTIFVTAYDQHALTAFELTALDYLLKPFENERFHQTLARAREIIRLKKVDSLRTRLLSLLDDGSTRALQETPPPARPPKYLERVAVELRGQTRVLQLDRIDYIMAEGNYVRLHSGDDSYLLTNTLNHLEEQLDPVAFCRIHRSTIVQLDRVESILTASGGDYAIRLRDGKRLRVARSRKDILLERLGLDRGL